MISRRGTLNDLSLFPTLERGSRFHLSHNRDRHSIDRSIDRTNSKMAQMGTTPSLLSPTSASTATATTASKLLPATTINVEPPRQCRISTSTATSGRRHFVTSSTVILGGVSSSFLFPVVRPATAASDDEYAKETADVISKVRSTINMDKSDPNVASAVATLREASNFWVAKYRKEKALLGRPSFRDTYSALNAVSGHYISFGPTAPIPAKRKARILEEMDTAEKALLRGR